MLRKTPVALALAALCLPFSPSIGWAQNSTTNSAPAPDSSVALSEVTVSSTRTERSTDAVPNTVSVYGKKKLAQRDARDLKALLDQEVDLAVRAASPRFTAAGAATGRGGNEGLNIRGLEGNQVLMLVDGIRLPQSFNFGAFSSGRLDYTEMDTLAGAEVLRGPASAQYGSDGLAGALSLRTLSPEDLLVNGKTMGGFARASWLSVDRSLGLSGAVAGRSGDWTGLLLLSSRSGHETENHGDNQAPNSSRTAANPADISSKSWLLKTGLRINGQHQVQATAEGRRRQVDTDVLSARAETVNAKTPSAVVDLQAQDRLERQRFSLEHRFEDLNASWLHALKTQLYVQDSETRQFASEDRHISPDRTRSGQYRERLLGLSSQAQTQLPGQMISYGLDLSRNRIQALRDGTVPPAGETFPSKPFPDTDYTQLGGFVQSELAAGNFSLVPGLRYDSYRLAPKPEGYSGTAVRLSDQALTPRLGLVWRATEQLQPYAQWALGFRAPAPDQVNNGFANPVHDYMSIGNPELKAEHANSLEAGLRGQPISGLRWQLSAYYNRYKDFISQQVVRGSGRPNDPLVFQYINLQQAQIRGAEARLIWQAAPGLELNAAIAHSRGDSQVDGADRPLDTIQPTRASLSAKYESGPWSLRANWLHSAAKPASQVSDAKAFLPPSFDVIDLGASYRISAGLSANVLITNLGDRKYWQWADVRGLEASNAVLDAYTAPGRQVQLSLRADF
ncbi:MAG: TonB-dependent hemoglobin/transferrin/lactoferrin family receptor [Burkholderiaceae bacterium]|nr:TonB-dependent hemoglobin/transferrin/lactoferrin family receptor [Burkholderiaceae bacterium]